MLHSQNRRLFLEALRPPERSEDNGSPYQLDFALGTTYSLDLIALLAAPVAFAFDSWENRDGRPVLEPLALLKALRQYADRMLLCCQAGKIYLPKNYQALISNLEQSICQVRAPRGGSFHPKVWVLRFVAAGNQEKVIYRVLCMSRNMTFDRSWDTLLCLEGELRVDRVRGFPASKPLGDFVQALEPMALRKMTDSQSQRLAQLADEIRRVKFDVPEPFDEFQVQPLGIDGYEQWPFPEGIKQLLVVSPFVDDHCLAELAEFDVPSQLVSRVESLMMLKLESLQPFEKVWTLDDMAEPEPGDNEEQSQVEVVEEAEVTPEGEIPLVGLHAKLYVADIGWDACVWTGSANATRSGFHRNVEMLVQLTGKRSKCGVEAVLGNHNEGGPKRVSSLSDMLQPYLPLDSVPTDYAEQLAFERSVEKLSVSLASALPTANCTSDPNEEAFSLKICPTTDVAIELPANTQLTIWPISLSPNSAQSVNVTAESWAQFESLSFAALTSFFAFELRTSDGKRTGRFVLNVQLLGAPANRQERTIRLLLSDPAKVLRYMLLLLLDQRPGDMTFDPPVPGTGNGTVTGSYSLFDGTLFESLVKALDSEPIRIDQVAQVVEDLKQTPEGQALLPPGFDAIWEPVWEVRQRQRLQENQLRT